MSQWLVDRVSGVLGSRSSRRSFLRRTAVAATALSVAPLDYVLHPVSAYAAVCGCAGSSCGCGQACCDGYTEFCCTLTGANACPSGTFVGGWWKADGSIYCSGPRYYIDCMATCSTCSTGCRSGPFCDPGCDATTCRCALGSCANRHAGCTTFRYGQCHQEIGCSGRISCRVASCTPPWLIDSTCTTASATDDNTANHNVACLETAPPVWSGWSPLTPPAAGAAGAPAVASWAAGRLDVFVRGGDGHLYHRWTGDSAVTWSSWEDRGAPPGGLGSDPAAVSWGPDRIDVFAAGGDQALWHTWWADGRWYNWERRGGEMVGAPAVASWAPGRLDVLLTGVDHQVWHTWYDGTWSGFEPRGGRCLSSPAAVSWAEGRVDVFVLGVGNLLYRSWWDGRTWSGWVQEVAGAWASAPAVASWAPGRLDVFLESSAAGHPLAHAWSNRGGWSTEVLDGALTAAPAAVSWASQRIDVVVRGTDGGLWHKWFGT